MAVVKVDILDLSWAKVPMFKALLLYAIGIFLATFVVIPFSYYFLLTLGVVLFGMGIAIWKRRKDWANILYIPSFMLFFCSLGIWQVVVHQSENQPNYFAKYSASEFVGMIDDEPIVNEKTIRFPVKIIAALDSLTSRSTTGKMMITVLRDSLDIAQLNYGDVILFHNHSKLVDPPFNPNQFDYKRYLSLKGIAYQNFLKISELRLLESGKGNFILASLLELRISLLQKFRTFIADDEAYQIAIALIFGYRSQVSEESIQAFTNTGTIHVLSVSGLHVGLLYGFLMFVLRWLLRFRYGKWIRSIIILLVIWGYVILTGMSPPILRAGIMISFFTLSMLFSRKQIPLNTLFNFQTIF